MRLMTCTAATANAESDMDLWPRDPGTCDASHAGAEPGGFKERRTYISSVCLYMIPFPVCVLQVYIRIKDDEWNVYRRYAEFRSLHHKLQSKYQQVRTFNFPPKKAIGNKVLERTDSISKSWGKNLSYPYTKNEVTHRCFYTC